MGCNNINSCGDSYSFAPCIKFEATLPQWSGLSEECNVSIEDTTVELYSEITKIKDFIEIPETSEFYGNTLIEIVTKIETKLNLILTKIQETNLCNYDMTGCVTLPETCEACSEAFTLGNVIQYLIDGRV